MTNEELIRLAKNGDVDAFNLLFEQNERLIHLIAHRWETSLPYEELVSCCWLGMLKAYRAFNPDKGIKFSTLYTTCAENEIRVYLRNIQRYKKFNFISLERTYNKMNGPEEEEIEIADEINQYDELIGQMFVGDIRIFIDTLPYNKRRVFEEHIIGTLNQPETAEKLGIAQSWVSRIRKSVLKDIQKFLRRHKVM